MGDPVIMAILHPREFCRTGTGRLVISHPSLVAGAGFKTTESHNWVRCMYFSPATGSGLAGPNNRSLGERLRRGGPGRNHFPGALQLLPGSSKQLRFRRRLAIHWLGGGEAVCQPRR